MRKTASVQDAKKKKLSKLPDRVDAGEVIGLSKPAKQIATIVAFQRHRPDGQKAIARLRKLRIGSSLNGLSITELKNAGRR